ncbi:MAG: LacI family DNA-binding transcriptional regulator, partial [Verrucomicrobiota bacterium]
TDIAREADVSVAMVYSLLKGTYYGNGQRKGIGISPKTRTRIIDACRKLNYQPEDISVMTRIYPESGDYAFLMSNQILDGISNPYFAPMLQGASARLDSPAWHISLASFDSSIDYLSHPDQLPHCVTTGTATKFMMVGPPNYSLILTLLQKGNVAVYLSRKVNIEGVVSVVPDYRKASTLSLKHLQSLGHTHIAVCAKSYFKEDEFNTQEHQKGIEDSIRRFKLPEKTAQIVFQEEKDSEHRPDSLVRQLLERRPKPTAIFCLDDWTAAGIISSLQSLNISVPEDVSVVGCGNHRNFLTPHPTLTTIDIPKEEIGNQAMMILQGAFDRSPSSPLQDITLPVKLIRRESTSVV